MYIANLGKVVADDYADQFKDRKEDKDIIYAVAKNNILFILNETYASKEECEAAVSQYQYGGHEVYYCVKDNGKET